MHGLSTTSRPSVGSRRPFCNFVDFIGGLCEFSLNERPEWKMIIDQTSQSRVSTSEKRTSPNIMSPKEQQAIRIAEKQNEAEKGRQQEM
jgi:hypothetical protein